MSADRFVYSTSSAGTDITLLEASLDRFAYGKHAHEEYAFGVTLSGAQQFVSEGKEYCSLPGQVMLFSPEALHDGHSGSDELLHWRMVYVHPDRIAPMLRAAGVQDPAAFRIPDVTHDSDVLRRLVLRTHALLGDDNSEPVATESVLYALVEQVVFHCKGTLADMPLTDKRHMQLAKEYMQAHAHEPLTLDDISTVAGMTKYHFIRSFKRVFGITPHQFLVHCRVRLALKYLGIGKDMLSVAMLSGFADQSHLNRHFKRCFGVTPKQYQKVLHS